MAEVSYTVKEILAQMDDRAAERHADLVRRIDAGASETARIDRRVSNLEQYRAQEQGGVRARSSLITGVLVALGVIVNIPVAVFYLAGGHG